MSISGLVVEYIVAIDVARVRFPADALLISALHSSCYDIHRTGCSEKIFQIELPAEWRSG